jgi:hypothetical protein
MKSTPSVRLTILFGMYVCAATACAPTILMSKPVSKTADGGALTLGEVKAGPNEYIGEGAVQVDAGDDHKLIWTLLTVKNAGPQDQTFSYDTCVLTGSGEAIPPSVVDRNAGEINAAADRAEEFNPGQERTRKLVYNYPEKQRPTAMKCDAIVLPIKAAK